jgi:prepilin-type N-terminal cleavage/methylation domain-containing protein
MIRLKHSSTRAFTLIELLVVITIIAILVGLAIPMVGRATRSAKTVESVSNMRQIYIMLQAHLMENNNFFPSALGGDRNNPAGSAGPYFWRRAIWESANGPFEGTSAQIVESMENSGYADLMWCPLMVGKYGQEQHPGGRGSYAINFFFIDSDWRVGTDYRNINHADVIGRKEPIIMTGTVLESNPEYGTWEAIQSSNYPYDTSWMNLHYAYGSGGDRALGLYKNGNVEMIKREDGIDLHGLLSDPSNLE